jgi:site-specific DNA-cytosine methylase
MDPTSPYYVDRSRINCVSLCSGYGGLDLGLRRCLGDRLLTVAHAEIEATASELLLSRMQTGHLDAAPIWSDLRTFPWRRFLGLVDLVHGGYPCQPYSVVGRRLGDGDPRAIWSSIRDGLAVVRPAMVFFENVEGHLDNGCREVVGDLVDLGYRVEVGLFAAEEVGSPQGRARMFMLGLRPDHGLDLDLIPQRNVDVWPAGWGERPFCWEPPRSIKVVADSEGGESRHEETGDGGPRLGGGDAKRLPSGVVSVTSLDGSPYGSPGWLGHGGLLHAVGHRRIELALLGNGVVPAQVERGFRALVRRLTQ